MPQPDFAATMTLFSVDKDAKDRIELRTVDVDSTTFPGFKNITPLGIWVRYPAQSRSQ